MKKYFKLLLLLTICCEIKANHPAADSIVCSDPDTFAFEAQTINGRWSGTLSITGTLMLAQQMHSAGGRILSPRQFYLYKFVQAHSSDGCWQWKYKSGTTDTATYTSSDRYVVLKLNLAR